MMVRQNPTDLQFDARAQVHLQTADQTSRFARRIAPMLGAGDTLLLSGPIGAGKTHFVRALIRKRLEMAGRTEDVPSPTFTLVQTYQADDLDIWHADLYRLANSAEVWELGLEEAFETALCLVEWPDRMGESLPADRLELSFATGATGDERVVTIAAHGPHWADRFAQIRQLAND